MSWLKLDSGWRRDARCIRAGRNGRDVFLAALEMAKDRRWHKGIIPVEDFDPELICIHLGWDMADGGVEAAAEGLAACIRTGLLTEYEQEGGNAVTLKVRSWAKHQTDPKGAERQARHREKRNAVTNSSLDGASDESNGSVTGVTGRVEREREYSNPPKSPLGEGGTSSGRNGSRRQPKPEPLDWHGIEVDGTLGSLTGFDPGAARVLATSLRRHLTSRSGRDDVRAMDDDPLPTHVANLEAKLRNGEWATLPASSLVGVLRRADRVCPKLIAGYQPRWATTPEEFRCG